MKLHLCATNICGSRSPFCLVGLLPKLTEPTGQDVIIDLSADLDEVVRVQSPGVDPGETLVVVADVDDVDLCRAQWTVPRNLRGRFRLDVLRWGDLDLLEQPGII